MEATWPWWGWFQFSCRGLLSGKCRPNKKFRFSAREHSYTNKNQPRKWMFLSSDQHLSTADIGNYTFYIDIPGGGNAMPTRCKFTPHQHYILSGRDGRAFLDRGREDLHHCILTSVLGHATQQEGPCLCVGKIADITCSAFLPRGRPPAIAWLLHNTAVVAWLLLHPLWRQSLPLILLSV